VTCEGVSLCVSANKDDGYYKYVV